LDRALRSRETSKSFANAQFATLTRGANCGDRQAYADFGRAPTIRARDPPRNRRARRCLLAQTPNPRTVLDRSWVDAACVYGNDFRRQEFYEGEAEDWGKVVNFKTSDGLKCTRTREWSPLALGAKRRARAPGSHPGGFHCSGFCLDRPA